MTSSFREPIQDIEHARQVCHDLARHVLRYAPNMTLLSSAISEVYDAEGIIFLPVSHARW